MGTTAAITGFSDLYQRHSGDVYRFALALCGREHEAQDILSETFLRAWTARDTIRVSTVRSYLFAIARNLFLEGLRKNRRESPLDFDVADSHDLARDHQARADWLNLETHILMLKPEDRAALVLHTCFAMPYEEIASITGLPVSTLKVKVHRARLELARAIDRETRP